VSRNRSCMLLSSWSTGNDRNSVQPRSACAFLNFSQ